ncbi:LysR substrate-binding domain-containing protein [Mycolicibacterium goodii]|uniref:LysR family transcriptional regulator n=1 Tax=Mycolicibacterium goodii TaxID=134601 RepID=A0ABS6HXT7_MYCGD|nr:LysR substrate-binding domain-containing protein [Mycolicibacterium goodii]MBU8827476.1 LysR family transcriptional regulator [Mycolicibacterium goodii]MBU8841611.1 LysR family transcriptional regulator [Mycolicibacterium goodii]
MDIQELKAFLAVAEELHFGRAAERLHTAQPPLSRTIKQLERQLGAKLFERSTRLVRLTPGGEALVEPAKEVLAALTRAEIAVQNANDGAAGVVRIAFAGMSTHPHVARLARVVGSRWPGIRLELSSQNFAQPAMRKLLVRDTDIALGRWDVIPAAVESRVVMRDELVAALPDTHGLAARSEIAADQLADVGFISLPAYEGSVLPDRLQRIARANGFVANVVQVAPDTQTALALVSAEVGCHLTFASVARNAVDQRVVFIPIRGAGVELDVDLRAAWRRDDCTPALRSVLHCLFDSADDSD